MISDNEDDDGEPTTKEASCKEKRRRFTIQEKASLIRTVERLIEQHGMTRREACEDLNITSGWHALGMEEKHWCNA